VTIIDIDVKIFFYLSCVKYSIVFPEADEKSDRATGKGRHSCWCRDVQEEVRLYRRIEMSQWQPRHICFHQHYRTATHCIICKRATSTQFFNQMPENSY